MADLPQLKCRVNFPRTTEGEPTKRACIIGSGPNGLAAAIVLAQAGLRVEVYEAEAEPGGAVRTLPLTLPGFLHDFGSAVHPLAAGSPLFTTLPLSEYGLEWIHGEAPLAHPLDDGSAVLLERDLAQAERELGSDGKKWRRLMAPGAEHWPEFARDALAPPTRVPHHPLRMAALAIEAFQPARILAKTHFEGHRARALFAGLAGHSFLSFDHPISSGVPLVLGAAAHAVGWPVPRGGARAITHALICYFESLGGVLHTSHRVDANEFRELAREGALMMCDLTPRQLLALAGDLLTVGFRLALAQFRYGPGVFKVDYALSQPVPWRAEACRRAITVHLGGTFEEIAASESEVTHGRIPERPFILAAQPSLFDPARAPRGKHVLWAYCHVPNSSEFDMTERIEAQIERFAPGFRDCILARDVSSPARLEEMDANILGGDIQGGELNLRQFFFRPTMRNYGTSNPSIFLCSSSTPPGGGVHGMCGYHAAKLALRRLGGA
jgi:phytoene dehydrogenase-like protein